MIINNASKAAATLQAPLVATLERVGHLTRAWPPLAAITRSLRTSTLLPDPRHGGRLSRVAEPLFRRIDDPHYGPGIIVQGGLEAIDRRVYEREGYAVVEAGDRPPALPWPDLEAAARIGPVDGLMLGLVRQCDRGVVAYDGRRVDPSRLVAQVALAFPRATIAVVCTRKSDVSRLAAQLRRHVPDVRWVTGESPLGKVGRVVVSTPLALGQTAVDLPNRDIVIVMDAVEAVGVNPRFALQHTRQARIYGLREVSRALAPRDRDRVAELFGFEEVVVPRHGCHLRPVEVAFRRIVGGPALAEGMNIVALKRSGVWHHGLRNRLVARLARDMAAGDVAAIRTPNGAASALRGVGETSVVVLVEALEHALALATALPGWGIVAGPDVDALGLAPSQAEILSGSGWACAGNPPLAIATMRGLGQPEGGLLDVLIRADGGVGVPAAVAKMLITGNQINRPLLLVDFEDRHHPELLRRSRARRDEYRRRGWSVDGVPAPTALDRFLTSRPGRER